MNPQEELLVHRARPCPVDGEVHGFLGRAVHPGWPYLGVRDVLIPGLEALVHVAPERPIGAHERGGGVTGAGKHLRHRAELLIEHQGVAHHAVLQRVKRSEQRCVRRLRCRGVRKCLTGIACHGSRDRRRTESSGSHGHRPTRGPRARCRWSRARCDLEPPAPHAVRPRTKPSVPQQPTTANLSSPVHNFIITEAP